MCLGIWFSVDVVNVFYFRISIKDFWLWLNISTLNMYYENHFLYEPYRIHIKIIKIYLVKWDIQYLIMNIIQSTSCKSKYKNYVIEK